MRKLLAVACLSLAVVLAATAVQAATRVLTVYPQQLLDWSQIRPSPSFDFNGNYIHGNGLFFFPVKLPIGATVTQLKVWSHAADGTGTVSLIRLDDVNFYKDSIDDLASVEFQSNVTSQFLPQSDIADGPAPARIAAGYHYFLRINLSSDGLGKIQIIYKTP